jgi:hypothetical protein
MQGKPPPQSRDKAKGIADAQPERSEVMFDPYLTSSHPFVTAMADNLALAYEHLLAPRQRKMKARDRENLHAILHAVFANLANAAAQGIHPPRIGVSLRASKRKLTRYDRAAFSGLPKILETISAVRRGGFSLSKSTQKGTASALTADAGLAESLARFKFRAEHFGHAPGRETIWLSRAERDYVDGTLDRELIDYADTPETLRYREEMATINTALRSADTRMLPDGGQPVLTSLRELHRSFNLTASTPAGVERFDLGGRLFGGFWQSLEKPRRRSIRLDGEPVADLDFAAMFLRLAYLEVGESPPPEGDLYAAVPGLSGWRKGVKIAANAMLFRTSPMLRLPKKARDHLPPRLSCASVRAAILAGHPALAPVFETGIGYRLMFLESQILVAAMLRLIAQGVSAVLPMHDGLMCPRSKAELVRQTMSDAAEQTVGFRLPISLKQQQEL